MNYKGDWIGQLVTGVIVFGAGIRDYLRWRDLWSFGLIPLGVLVATVGTVRFFMGRTKQQLDRPATN